MLSDHTALRITTNDRTRAAVLKAGMIAPHRVCLSISAYRSDESVLRLLESALSVADPPFGKILVVDSLSSGVVPGEILKRGWSERVEYRSFPTNLGSAGNLAQRLRIPTEQGFDFVYAINHDGLVAPEIIRLLLAHADDERVGAVYPLRRYTKRGNRFDLTGLTRFPVPALVVGTAPSRAVVKAHWGSSNGALYATRPLRHGARVLDELWLGWEDLAYGWSLDALGYEQRLVTAAVLDDDYEYENRRIGPVQSVISEKP
ncbi:MAG: glycosyltransferase, partial [Archangium sp.]